MCTHPTRPNWSQVYYSADLALKNYVPGFIMNILTTSALKTAVSWVKKFSEAEWVEEEKCSVIGAGRFPRFGRGVRDETRMFKIGGLKALHPFSIAPSPPPPPPVPVRPRRPIHKRPALLAAAGVAGATAAVSVICGVVRPRHAMPRREALVELGSLRGSSRAPAGRKMKRGREVREGEVS